MSDQDLFPTAFLPAAGLKYRPLHEHRAGSLIVLPSGPDARVCYAVKIEAVAPEDPRHAHALFILQGSPWPDEEDATGEMALVAGGRRDLLHSAVLGAYLESRVEFPIDGVTTGPDARSWTTAWGALALGASGPKVVAGMATPLGVVGVPIDVDSWKIDRTARADEQQVWLRDWALVLKRGAHETRIAVRAPRRF